MHNATSVEAEDEAAQDNSAEWISGAYLAELADASPDATFAEAFGDNPDARTEFGKFCAQLRKLRVPGFDIDAETVLADMPALPAPVFHALGIEPTRRAVAEWSADTFEDHDPQEYGDDLKAVRDARTADRAAQRTVARTLPASTEYAVVALPEPWQQRAQEYIDQDNYARRNDPYAKRTANGVERHPLIQAWELHRLGMPAADIATLTAATFEDRIAAERQFKAATLLEREAVTALARTTYVEPADFSRTVGIKGLGDMPLRVPLVGHFLYRGEPAEIIGEPNHGKTAVSIEMACSLALGRTMTGGHEVPAAARVLYVLAEGVSGASARINAWLHDRGVSQEAIEDQLRVYPDAIQLTSEEDMARLQEFVLAARFDAVFFDTKAHMTVGAEENSATEQGRAIAALARLNRLGIATVVLHHTARGTEHGRGSTAWLGAAYTSLLVTKSEDGEVTVKCKKNKDAAQCAEAHTFAFKTVQVPAEMMLRATRTDQREGGVLVAVEPSHGAEDGIEARAWRELERQVREHPGTLNTGGAETLLREHGVSQTRARKLVAHGTREGGELLVQKGTGRRNRGVYLYPGADPLSSIENRLIDHPAAIEARADAEEIERAADRRAATTATAHQRRAEADRAEIDSAAAILRNLDQLPTLTAAKRLVRERSGGALKAKNIEAAHERVARERDGTAVA